MEKFIGIDLGTSSVKLLLVAEDGNILNSITQSYDVSYPRDGWSEQNPEDWFEGVKNGVKLLLNGFDKTKVKGIGVGGQMHGLVALDNAGKVIRPCILWNDGRCEAQTAYLNDIVGRKALSEHTANVAFAGFTAPKLLWLKENEPHNFKSIKKILLPKDYIAFRLCGNFSTDYSDASGTLLLDVKNKRWSPYMLDLCDIPEDMLPTLYESWQPVGTLTAETAEELGLPSKIIVCAGAGDNAAAAVGTGTVNDGDCNISLGTSGTVFVSRDRFSANENNALHSFAHANGKYHLMGCILSAASCNRWWMENVLKTNEFAYEQQGAESVRGNNDVFFLPYLMGERCPHNDVNARGAFIGMRPTSTRLQMTLAVMEGVAFALRECVETAEACGARVSRTKICGGGANSPLWRQIIADVMGVPVDIPLTQEGPAYGGAMLAMVACGRYGSVESAAKELVRVKETVLPVPEKAKLYNDKYNLFKKLYPALKNVFGDFKEL